MPRERTTNRWQLTEDSWSSLLRALHSEEDLAVERYQRLHQRLTYFFMRHRTVSPEDLVDEVIDRLAGLLREGRAVGNIEAFSLGVARMVLRENEARLLRDRRSHEEAARNKSDSPHTSIEREAALDAMEAELAALPAQSCQMLTDYHAAEGAMRIQTRRNMASAMNMPLGTLRKRVFDLQTRLQRKLQRTLTENIAKSPGEERHG